MIKKLNLLIIFSILTSFTFGDEIIDEDYIFNPNLKSESLPSKPKQNKNLAYTIVTESSAILLEYGVGLAFSFSAALGTGLSILFDTVTTYKEKVIMFQIANAGGTALGTYLIGSLFHRRGRFLPSLIGSSLSSLPVGLALALGWEVNDDLDVAILLCAPPIGAVIGYNLSRIKRKTKLSFLEEHFDQPYFSLRAERTNENEIIPVFDFRLVNARF